MSNLKDDRRRRISLAVGGGALAWGFWHLFKTQDSGYAVLMILGAAMIGYFSPRSLDGESGDK
jgi:hypothetical protein